MLDSGEDPMTESATVSQLASKRVMKKSSRIAIAGSLGLVGSAICRALQRRGYSNLILWHRSAVDLRDAPAIQRRFEIDKPEYVFLAAGRVGGILANDLYPADFLQDNLAIQSNVLQGSWRYGVRKILTLGSSCIYPKLAPQPIKEDYLLTGLLEPTNQWYAIAKIAGIKLAQAYQKQYGLNAISLMPTNLYGPGDNFDLNSSHVLPALIRKCHEAKKSKAPTVTIWGTGSPMREFLHVDDLADAALFLMLNYDSPEIINVGVGEDISIRQLAEIVRQVVGFEGDLVFDTSKPDGTPRKLLDISRLTALGWKAKISLCEGIKQTYGWYLQQTEFREVHFTERQAA
jgi:GDP-L-fucose synthase